MNLKSGWLIIRDLHELRFRGSKHEFIGRILTPTLSHPMGEGKASPD
jgi:hypothetical protein